VRTAPHAMRYDLWFLLLESRRKVLDQSERLADLLRNPVEKNLLAIRSHIVERDAEDGPIADQLLRSPELQCTTTLRDRYCQ
jgi:hypothetical protein